MIIRSAFWLALFGAGVFVCSLVIHAPLAVFADQQRLAQRGITYDRAQGTIWSGDLLGVTLAGQPIGAVTLDLKPGGLLLGQLDYDFSIQGPAGVGRGDVAVAVTGGITLRGVVADINLQAIERLSSRLQQVPATVSVTVPELVADRSLACRRADGRLRTDLLQQLGGRLSWQGPAMAGIVTCDGEGGYQLTLQNVDGADAIRVDATLSPDTQAYALEARVQTVNQSVADTLVLMKFQRAGDEFIYSRANGVVRSMGEAG